ncbi:MAG: hypothetical protein ACOYUZ_00705 [Patescibacteria group bacterium]
MARRYVPKGTCLVLMRHARSCWNNLKIEALEAGSMPPERVPGKRDADLMVDGRVEAYLTGLYLADMLKTECESNIDVIGYSMRARAEETVQYVLQSSGFRPRHVLHTAYLDERHHSQFTAVDLRRIHNHLAAVLNMHSHRDAYEQLLASLQNRPSGDRNRAPGFKDLAGMVPYEDPDILLRDFIGDVGIQLFINFREAYDYQMARLEELGEQRSRQERSASSLAYAIATVQSRYAPHMVDWIEKEKKLKPHLRRKTPSGENLPDMRARAEKVLEVLGGYADDMFGARIFVIVTHSLFLLVLRQLIEDFPDSYLDKVLLSEGPPFPPHVGMAVYQSYRGYLKLQGETENPYRLAPELISVGRRLAVRGDADPEKIRAAAQAVNASFELVDSENSNGEKRVYQFKENKCMDPALSQRPGLAAFGTRRPPSLKKVS